MFSAPDNYSLANRWVWKSKRNPTQHGDQNKGPLIFAGEHRIVDFKRNGVGSAGDIAAAEHQGDADLAQGAGKSQG